MEPPSHSTMRTTGAKCAHGVSPAPVDEEIARLAAERLGTADREAGDPMESGIKPNDASIAATARAYSESVVTRNVTDFEQFGMSVEI
jgi:predicted nucleic acid-binding protein